MAMLVNKERDVIKCHLDSLGDPDFCDGKILASDGELPVSKFLLGIRSPYFRSMFSDNNNFLESQTGSVKMPYSKSVLEKVVVFLYSGKMSCEDLSLSSLLDLMDLLNLTNLPEEYVAVETFTINKMKKESFSLSDCLRALDHCSRLGLETVGSGLMTHLGGKFVLFSQDEAVGNLSQDMLVRLLEEKREVKGQTILRFRTLLTWLSVNEKDIVSEELLEKFDFDDFTTAELATDVRKSGLYETDRIIERMEELYQTQFRENRKQVVELAAGSWQLASKITELENSLETKDAEIRQHEKKITEYKEDISIIKGATDKRYKCMSYGRCYTEYNVWSEKVPSTIRFKDFDKN